MLPALEAPATAEGGDMFFLDDRTLLVGLSYRTNEAAVAQLRPRLAEQGVEIVTFDLSHFHGPGECLHLMSFISPLDADLAVVYLPMMPVRLVHLLEARGIAIVEVPEEEFPSIGPNVLALGPRRAITVDANPVTREPARGRRRRGPDLSRRPRQSQRRRRADVPHAGPRAGMIDLWVFLHITCVALFLLFHGVQMWAMFALAPALPDREKIFDRAEQSRMASTPMYVSLGLLVLFGVIAGIDGDVVLARLVAVGRDRRPARHRRAR